MCIYNSQDDQENQNGMRKGTEMTLTEQRNMEALHQNQAEV